MENPNLSAVGKALVKGVTRRALIWRAMIGAIVSAAVPGLRQPQAASASGMGKFGKLSDMTGAALVFEWAPDGSLVDFESSAGFHRDFAVDAAKYGAAVTAMAPGLAAGYSGTTSLRWDPYKALVVVGGEWTAVLGSNNRGAWIKASEADLRKIIEAVDQGRNRTHVRRLSRTR